VNAPVTVAGLTGFHLSNTWFAGAFGGVGKAGIALPRGTYCLISVALILVQPPSGAAAAHVPVPDNRVILALYLAVLNQSAVIVAVAAGLTGFQSLNVWFVGFVGAGNAGTVLHAAPCGTWVVITVLLTRVQPVATVAGHVPYPEFSVIVRFAPTH